MNEIDPIESQAQAPETLSSELLILPDGRILVHNLTPTMASVLRELNPDDDTIKTRAAPESRRRDAAGQRIV